MQEKIDLNSKLGDIVAKHPETRKVFEEFDLDYCCSGNDSIKNAIEGTQIDANILIKKLEEAINEPPEKEEEKIWINEPLKDIVNHILSTHHAFLRKELPYTYKLLDKVVMVHGPKHGHFLNRLNDIYTNLQESLEQHLNEEENTLFPYIKELEDTTKQEKTDKDFEKFQKIIEILYSEHEEAGEALREIRNLTSNYTLPSDACESFKALYENLQDIESDLHTHVHLENSVLFPRVKKLLEI